MGRHLLNIFGEVVIFELLLHNKCELVKSETGDFLMLIKLTLVFGLVDRALLKDL